MQLFCQCTPPLESAELHGEISNLQLDVLGLPLGYVSPPLTPTSPYCVEDEPLSPDTLLYLQELDEEELISALNDSSSCGNV